MNPQSRPPKQAQFRSRQSGQPSLLDLPHPPIAGPATADDGYVAPETPPDEYEPVPEDDGGAAADRRAAADLAAARQRKAEDLVADLNPQQRAAVEHRGAPLLVVAGAGSGKTRVLTRRIAHLLAVGDAAPGEILAITFTNKAAAEMKERVAHLVGGRARAMWVSTFHSMCVRILRADATQLGYKSSFTIYDQADSQRLVTLVANGMDLDAKKFPARSLAASISNLKNDLLDPAAAATRADTDQAKIVAEVYAEYQARLKAASSLDFDDLIMETVALLQTFPDVAEHYRRRFRHVLVDEYQDTNHAQYVLVRELVGGAYSDREVRAADGEIVRAARGADTGVAPAELVVVGDADQSIYAFRGASIRNIVEFESDYPNARTILLEQNYRSTQHILTAANALISRNSGRRAKNLWTAQGSGERIVGYVADNEQDEAAFVCGEIDSLAHEGVCRYGDVAVFYRTNAASRAFEDMFVRLGMPYRIVGGVRFYERREVKDALAYLRALANDADEVSLRRVLNVPKRGIGERAEAAIALFAEQQKIPFAEALSRVRDVPFIVTRSTNAIEGFNAIMAGLRGLLAGGADPSDLLAETLTRSGYLAELEHSSDPQEQARVDNLEQLVTVLRERAEVLQQGEDPPAAGLGTLLAVLEQLSLVADADQVPDSEDGVVTLMTLHTAKGLEFPVVFLTGWEDGLFPHMRALLDPTELSEERRLAYVGITRAQQRLYVSRAVTRYQWGQPSANPASRFLEELPSEVMDWRRLEQAPEPEWSRSAPVSAGRFGESAQSRIAAGGMRTTNFKGWQNKPVLELSVGDRVNHDKYGLGKVVAAEGSGVRATATIDFGAAGTVRLMLIGGVPMQKL